MEKVKDEDNDDALPTTKSKPKVKAQRKPKKEEDRAMKVDKDDAAATSPGEAVEDDLLDEEAEFSEEEEVASQK